MAGLFGKTKYIDDPSPDESQPTQKNEAFFLDPDEAKTLGDINFMRTPNVIKRSFAKTLKGGGGKTIISVSSLSIDSVEGQLPTTDTPPPSPETNGKSDRNQSDSSLDIFRKMAKDLKK